MINAISHRLGVPSSSHTLSSPSVPSPSPSSHHRPSQAIPSVLPSTVSKEQIATNFGQSAQTYQAQAHLQRQCAHRLLAFLDESCHQHGKELPDGPILELGCGTGFITQHLIDRYLSRPVPHGHRPKRPLYITDLSSDMVAFCQHHITLPYSPASLLPCPISFHILDAETSNAVPATYSLIVGGFVAQWFKQLEQTVKRLLQQLKPGGQLLLSFPGQGSFPEWRECCDRLHLPYTAHPLPNPYTLIQQLQLSPHQYALKVEMCPTSYNSAKAFFKSMKEIGAGASDAGQSLSPKQMRQLLRSWNPDAAGKHTATHHSIEVHYEVVYLSILKE